ncbi:MAG TPA: A/G-specific adenine glycosylase [Terriglobales bacterium]|jgi:A/G-specific adenine glycosylase|nr:A/G-specific adenine glycosylase [Terriglobales bacterium]
MKADSRKLPADLPRRAFLSRRRLLVWYDSHRRDLPWRHDRDPYHVWLSEIMLQQTRVTAVLGHYRRFLQRFPTVEKLAAARESSVLAVWSGLGYYRRARMLHTAAKKIVRELAGKFPHSVEGLRALPGIGRYTAAAIASIAFGEPAAVVDGNVERALQRLLGENLRAEPMWQAAQELLSPERPGDFNQAMMELGATVCLPRAPMCLVCPVFDFCATRGEGLKPRKSPPQNKREVHYALHHRNGSVFLVKRKKDASLMPDMWELPEIPRGNGVGESCLTLRHSITVTDYVVRVLQGPAPNGSDGQWVPKGRIPTLPLTGLARKILRAAQVI